MNGGHTAFQLRSHSKGTLLFGSMPPVDPDVVSRGKEHREDLPTNIGAAAALEVSWLCDRIPQTQLYELLQCLLTQVSIERS